MCRGETLQRLLCQIREVHSLVPESVVMMALVATTTIKLCAEVVRTLGMTNELIVTISPCKATCNLMCAITTFRTIPNTFLPMVDRFRNDRGNFPPMIIYCRRYEDCANLYLFFKEQLGDEFTEPPWST